VSAVWMTSMKNILQSCSYQRQDKTNHATAMSNQDSFL